MYKMIILDIDGTISHKGKISENVINSIQEARKKGVIVTIASGRNTKGIRKIADQLGINDGKTPIIGLNGAEIFYLDKENKPTHIWEKPFPKNISTKVLEAAANNKISLFMYTVDNKVHYKIGNGFSFFAFMKVRTKENIFKLKKDFSNQTKDIIKFIAYSNTKKMDKFKNEIADLNLSLFSWSYVSKAKANVEINMPNVNKALGMKEAAEMLGIKQSEVVYFGDGGNDIEALKWAGKGIAMGNASDDIKQIADETTKSVNEDGVAYWINKNIK